MKKNNNIKKLSTLLLATTLFLTGCSTTSTTENAMVKPAINLATLKGPSGMGMAYLMEQDEMELTKADYNFTIFGSPEEIVSQIVNEDIDIATVPSNLAATLNVKTEENISMLAINTLGTLYVLERGDTVNSISDLQGKTISSAGQAATPEYIINYLLESAGISETTTVDFLAEHAETAAKILTGETDIVMVPEPFVTQITSKDPSIRVALDLTQEWSQATGQDLPMTAIIARADFVESNPESIKLFLEEGAQSVDYLNNNYEEASTIVEKFDIMTAAVAAKAIPNCNIVFITGEEIIESTNSYFEILLNSNPQSIGGKLPSTSFYYVG